MKRILLAMSQPPGCNGVQAVMFAKLLPYLEQHGWEFHFTGPNPAHTSLIIEDIDYPLERLHYSNNVSLSRILSVRKNRARRGGLLFYFYGALQLLAVLFERLTSHRPDQYLERGIARAVYLAEAQWNFDLIAGLSPGFSTVEMMSQIAKNLNKPFFAIFTDPYGARYDNQFHPSDPDLQTAILNDSCGVLFTSPVTCSRYVDAKLVPAKKAFFFTESFPETPQLYLSGRSELALQEQAGSERPLRIVYLGMWPEWRPADAFLDAVKSFRQNSGKAPAIQIYIYGYLYPAALARINGDPDLSRMIRINASVSYAESHWLAEDADLQLVVIGPRHTDNYPSKFFDYMAHHKPVLVLGPDQNPLRSILQDLQIGRYVDGMNTAAIVDALHDMTTRYSLYQQAFQDHQQQLASYGASAGATWICQVLDASLAKSHSVTKSL